nr:MAG TPA: hypothetical protein [Caudoviricetes sp.]
MLMLQYYIHNFHFNILLISSFITVFNRYISIKILSFYTEN